MTFLLSLMSVGAAGCVIPPSLTVDDGTEDNAPPLITRVASDTAQLVEPGPLDVVRGERAGFLTIQALDTNLDDTLYIRLFVNNTVDNPSPPRSSCIASPSDEGSESRVCTAELTALCLVSDPPDLLLRIQAFDRPLTQQVGDPPWQQMEDAAGYSSSRTFRLNCSEDTE